MIARGLRLLLAVLCVGLAIWQVKLLMAALGGSGGGANIETALAREGSFVVGITREGALSSRNVAQVRAPRSGSTLAWIVDDGTRVEEGEVIARVDVSQYQFDVERQRLEHQGRVSRVEQERRSRQRDFESSELNVEKTLRALELLTRTQLVEGEEADAEVGFYTWSLNWAATDYDKHGRLWQAGIVPESQVEQAERVVRREEFAVAKSEKRVGYLDAEHSSKEAQTGADVDTARFEAELASRRIEEAVQSAREQARMSGERLEEMEQELASGELRAPMAGVVVLGTTWDQSTGRRGLREGDRVWWRTKIADITDLAELEVSLRVEEASVGEVRAGQRTVIRIVGIPDREFEGEVSNVGAVAFRVPPWEDPNAPADQRVFSVTVKLREPDLEVLRPGMKARVQFVFEEIPEAVFVPVEAVFEKPEGQVVYVAEAGGFHARRVKTGKRSDEAVVILEGLHAGERVALTDPTRAEAD